MRIMIVTDAWFPQTNGVVSTLAQTAACLGRFGHEVKVLTPQDFRSVACPTYREIRLSLFPYKKIAGDIPAFAPQALHIATEGPLGFSARRFCLKWGVSFTTSYHTQFPQYLRARFPIPLRVSYGALRPISCGRRALHGEHRLDAHGTRGARLQEPGVLAARRRHREIQARTQRLLDLPRPIAAYVGRVAVEKNIDAFLSMPWCGSKIVIGDGPERARLQRQYPNAAFTGYQFGENLAKHLAPPMSWCSRAAPIPLGSSNLEAMACGVPVAAYPVTGPIDVIEDGVTGALDVDLAAAALRALKVDSAACRARALKSGWDISSREFENNLVPVRDRAGGLQPKLILARDWCASRRSTRLLPVRCGPRARGCRARCRSSACRVPCRCGSPPSRRSHRPS